jgi:hypothetical protein
MVTISFFGGLNLLAIGIVGLYVAQIFTEVKARPCIVKEVHANFAASPVDRGASADALSAQGAGLRPLVAEPDGAAPPNVRPAPPVEERWEGARHAR